MSRVAGQIDFDPKDWPLEEVQACNICGCCSYQVLAFHDRYGFEVQTCRCWSCNLVFLNPRMVADAYSVFYQRYYRPLVSAFHGRLINAESIEAEQYEYAQSVAAFIHDFPPGGSVLDVGGSTGVVCSHLADTWRLSGCVIDPSPDELRRAKSRGMRIKEGTAEDVVWPQSNLILICQTIDHVLNPSTVIRKARKALKRGGLLFVDIVDYSKTRTSKIDHPYNWTDYTIRNLLRRYGFEVIKTELSGEHIRYLCK